MLYTNADLQAIQAQKKKRWILLSIPVILFAIGVIVCFILRVEWATTVCTIIMFILLMAGNDLLIKPLRCYEQHLLNVLKGRTRECECAFHSMETDVSMVDGVAYHAFMVIDYDEKNKPYERLFYYDALLPDPGFKEGEMLHIVYHDKEIGSVERV